MVVKKKKSTKNTKTSKIIKNVGKISKPKLEKEFYVSENVNKNIKEDADIEKLKKELEEIEKKLSHL